MQVLILAFQKNAAQTSAENLEKQNKNWGLAKSLV